MANAAHRSRSCMCASPTLTWPPLRVHRLPTARTCSSRRRSCADAPQAPFPLTNSPRLHRWHGIAPSVAQVPAALNDQHICPRRPASGSLTHITGGAARGPPGGAPLLNCWTRCSAAVQQQTEHHVLQQWCGQATHSMTRTVELRVRISLLTIDLMQKPGRLSRTSRRLSRTSRATCDSRHS